MRTRNEQWDCSISRSFYADEAWFPGKRRVRQSNPSAFDLQQALNEQQSLAAYWEAKFREAKGELDRLKEGRLFSCSPLQGIKELLST